MRISDWSSDVCSSDLGQRRLDVGAADDLAHRALCGDLHRLLRLANVKEVLTGIGDLPLHREVDVDDVLVARQHQALFRNIATSGAGTLAAGALDADVDSSAARRAGKECVSTCRSRRSP